MKIYTEKELKKILRLHELWLEGDEKGQRANLSEADLRRADLRRADLRSADLSEANLSGVYLSWTNLSCATLSGANLSGANLSEANLRGANLYGANLRGANLSRADLRGTFGKIILIATFGRHTAIAADGYIRIGCRYLSTDDWITQGKQIGKDELYNKMEIKLYMAWIKFVKRTLK